MLKGTLRGWITCLVGMLLCILVVQVYLHVDNPQEVFTAGQDGKIKYVVTSTLQVQRRWSQSIKPPISMLGTSSVFLERRLLSELRPYSQGETFASTFPGRPFTVDSPAESLPVVPSPLFVAAGSVSQPAPGSIAGSDMDSGVNGDNTWLPSLSLPSMPETSPPRLSTRLMQLVSHALSPSPILSPATVAQPPPSTSLLHSSSSGVAPSAASSFPPPASPFYMPSPGPPPIGSANFSDSPFPSPFSGCCAENMVIRPGLPLGSCVCVYPIRLDLVVDNVSTDFVNWSSEFVEELASQLDVEAIQIEIHSFQFHGPNLSLVIMIGPLTNNSFSPQQAEKIKTDLDHSKVQLNSSLFGNYTLLQFVYFAPPVPPRFSPLPRLQELPQQAYIYRGTGSMLALKLIVAVAAGSVIVILALVILLWRYRLLCGTYSYNMKEAELEAPSSLFDAVSCDTGPIPTSGTTRLFTFDELKQATNGFEPASVLAEGGFGRVYKGVLKDGTAVAIKRMISENYRGDRAFLVEIEMLSRLHHRNLVKLLGYHTSRDSSSHLLCYELIPNGSLEAWLHGPVGAKQPLEWDIRMKIALDAARGLAYLHEDSQPCVIHRDFKASNILIENDFHAKVADFGLAKQAPEGHMNHVSTCVMGTFGYVAPEYAMTGHLLVKSDVYSYGVVLLELLSGRKPVDMTQPLGQENLVAWARPILRDIERLGELTDPRLVGKYPREDFTQVAAIAAACVAPEAVQRPTMGEVVQSLKMVQRSSECATSGERNVSTKTVLLTSEISRSFSTDYENAPQMSAAFESDGLSSVSSSGHFSGLNGFGNDIFSTTGMLSEDLHEGR